MAYQKQQWLANQTIISADRMNHIEDGIANIELTPGADGITPQLRLGDSGIEVSYDNGQQWQLLVPLSQITGPQGEPGQTVKIYKTYASVEAMNADAENVPEGSLVMIVSDVNDEDNGKIYSKGADGFVFVVDISGMQGIQGEQGAPGETGLTPVISVKAETLEAGAQATATRSGTDEAPLITFGIPRGADGAEGAPGKDGVTPDISAVAVSVPYGTPASVEKSGTAQAPVFTFSIPEGGNLLAQRTYDEGVTYVTEVGTTKNKLTLNATERPQIDIKDADSEKVAYLSEIEAIQELLPVMIQIPIRTLQDKVYDQATIFGWFGVEDIAGLRGLFSSQHLLWLRYGIASMGVGHMMYLFVVEYAEVNSDGNTIKLVFSGLDTKNDKLAKYEFTAKLDGTIVEGQSNVQLVVTDKE